MGFELRYKRAKTYACIGRALCRRLTMGLSSFARISAAADIFTVAAWPFGLSTENYRLQQKDKQASDDSFGT